jgi:FkbM family methyltransferase
MPKNIRTTDLILSRITPIADLSVITSIVKNWPDILFFRAGLKKRIVIRFKTGKQIRINDKEEYYSFIHKTKEWAIELARLNPKIEITKNFVKIRFSGRVVLLYYNSSTDLGNAAGLGIEQFVWEEYEELEVKGRDVIDIGACIGDTAIYFALKKSRHVYALEPFPASYELARKNVKLNGLGDKITMINAVVKDKHGYTRIEKGEDTSSVTHLKDFASNRGKKIPVLTLANLVEKYKIKDGILKIDTEGDEYKIIMSSTQKVLRRFSQIELEYHNGYLDLENKLKEAGFDVSHTVPKYSGYDDLHNPNMYVGLLFASRRRVEA